MKRLSHTLLAAVAALGITVAGAMAQAQAPAAAPLKPVSPAALASAKEILEAKGANRIYAGAVVGLTNRIKDALLQSNLNLQKDLDESAQKVVKDLNGREQEIGEQMAKIYANQFTEQELKDLATFYKSPLGKKTIDQEPQALQQSSIFMQQWATKMSEEIVTKMRAEMKARGKPVSG
ncbi:MAG: DUF2059 domain-containing protein [Afipia sp.]|nr:DUF2059 domain-containing protein [Afipia sp.]